MIRRVKNPDNIAVAGNDVPYFGCGIFKGDLDIVHTEYSCEYSASTAFNVSGYPPNAYSGHLFNILNDTARSKNAVVWYYSHTRPNDPNLALTVSYEALAYNCTIYSGDDIPNVVGTNETAKQVNTSINALRDTFSDRQNYSEIGVLYSSQSAYTQLLPGGYTDSSSDSEVAYMS